VITVYAGLTQVPKSWSSGGRRRCRADQGVPDGDLPILRPVLVIRDQPVDHLDFGVFDQIDIMGRQRAGQGVLEHRRLRLTRRRSGRASSASRRISIVRSSAAVGQHLESAR